MPVQCLNIQQKNDLYNSWLDDVSTLTLADRYQVSLRTVGRVIQEMKDAQQEYDEVETVVDEYEDEADSGFDNGDIEYFVVATRESISITQVSESGPVSCSIVKDDANFDEVSDIVWSGRGSQECLEEAFLMIDRPSFIEKYSNGNLTVDPEANRVYFVDNGTEIDFAGRLVPRLLESLASGKDNDNFKGLVEFAKRLINNTSNRAVNELYDFLEATDIEITAQGFVKCFKKVRGSYMDIYSNSFDNSPGKVLRMNRNMVNEDSDVTCSHGLHVCSKSYLPHFGASGGNRIVSVLVDPADFVAIPKDYNNAKARVCGYSVLEDVTDNF